MAGYIIGLVLGLTVFLFQNFKPTSLGFRIMFLLTSFVYLWFMYKAQIGFWNIFIIPFGEMILCFCSAYVYPYGGKAASMEYESLNGQNYFAILQFDDKIGRINPRGLKQSYDRIMGGLLSDIANNKKELLILNSLLYSKNFYPISIHTKMEILQHIYDCIDKMAKISSHGDVIRIKASEKIELLFNTYVSVMAIHEEATRNIEELKKSK